MKKLTLLYIAAFLALTLGLMLSCAKKDGSSSSEETDTSSSQSVTISTSLTSEFGNAKFGDVKFE
jgi:preprotein translocase subunit SecG